MARCRHGRFNCRKDIDGSVTRNTRRGNHICCFGCALARVGGCSPAGFRRRGGSTEYTHDPSQQNRPGSQRISSFSRRHNNMSCSSLSRIDRELREVSCFAASQSPARLSESLSDRSIRQIIKDRAAVIDSLHWTGVRAFVARGCSPVIGGCGRLDRGHAGCGPLEVPGNAWVLLSWAAGGPQCGRSPPLWQVARHLRVGSRRFDADQGLQTPDSGLA